MSSATRQGGELIPLEKCWLFIPNYGKVTFNNLPDLSDQKSAEYTGEPIIGRAFPLKTYSHSSDRSIGLRIHLFVKAKQDVFQNLLILRALQSCTYTRDESSGGNAPFVPPVICKLQCGSLLGDQPVCVVMKSYDVSYPTDVPWDMDTYAPWKFDVNTSWDVVYKNTDLPGQDRIINFGR